MIRMTTTSTDRRIHAAESQLRRNIGITDSVKERVRTKLGDLPIEDSPIKRDIPPTTQTSSRARIRDEQVSPSIMCCVLIVVVVQDSRSLAGEFSEFE